MAISFASVTGANMTGFTSPTFTCAADTPPSANGKQWAVSTLGGTQPPEVTASLAARPFTISIFKPTALKQRTLDKDGRVTSAPMNVYKVITRKGVYLDSLYTTRLVQITSTIEVPAGGELYDLANVRAAVSAHLGALYGQASGIGDLVNTGVL